MAKRRFRRIGATFVIVAGLGFVTALATGEIALVTTHGISMEPSFHTGDLAVIVASNHYRVGDVVGYHSPLLHIVVLHRIVAEHAGLFTFKGDNNSFLDPVRLPAAAIEGRLWLHIASGGVVLGWLRSPVVLGLLAFFVIAFGVGGASRRRLARGPAAGPGPRVVPERAPLDAIGVGWWPVATALALVAVFGLITGVSWGRATTRPSQNPLAYDNHVAFSYAGAAPAGITYPTGKVRTGDPVFLHLVDALRVGVHYSLLLSQPGGTAPDVHGTIGATAALEGPGGWAAPLTTVASVPFAGSSARLAVALDLSRIPALEESFTAETGVPLDDPEIVVTPVIHLHGTMAGANFGARLVPTLAFRVEGPVLDLLGAAAGGASSPSPKMVVVQPGSVERRSRVPAGLTILGRSLNVARARHLGLGGLLLSILTLVGACVWRTRRRHMGETERIHAAYGHDLVAVASSPVPKAPLVVDVATFDELARLARRYECVILEHAHRAGRAYYVESGATVYRCGVEDAGPTLTAVDDPEPEKAFPVEAVAAGLGTAASPDSAARSLRRRLRPASYPADDDRTKTTDDVDLLILLARAEWISGVGDAGGHLREAIVLAKKADLHQAMTEALVMNVRTAFDHGQPGDPEKIEWLEFSLGLPGHVPARRARLLGALAVESIFVPGGPSRTALLDEAQQLALRSADPQALIGVASDTFVARSRATWSARQFRLDQPLFDRARQAARILADPIPMATTEAHGACNALTAGDGQTLRARADALTAISGGTQNQVALRSLFLLDQAVAILDGRLAAAETLAAELSEASGSTAMVESDAARALTQLPLRREQDRLADLIPALSTDDSSLANGAAQAALAFALVEAGRRDDAAIALHKADDAGFGTIPDDIDWPVAVALWSEVAVLTGDRHAAAQLHEILRPHDGIQMSSGAVGCGPTARLLALLETLLGRSEEADQHFVEAVAFSRQLVSPVWTARCQLEWAQTQLDRGRTAEAYCLTEEAGAAAGEFALPALCRQWTAVRDQLDRS